jgi:hypothetical protein
MTGWLGDSSSRARWRGPCFPCHMSISLANGLGTQDPILGPSDPDDELEGSLVLAKELCSRLSMPMAGEESHGVRMRLVRAHALSIVDLLMDLTSDRTRGS